MTRERHYYAQLPEGAKSAELLRGLPKPIKGPPLIYSELLERTCDLEQRKTLDPEMMNFISCYTKKQKLFKDQSPSERDRQFATLGSSILLATANNELSFQEIANKDEIKQFLHGPNPQNQQYETIHFFYFWAITLAQLHPDVDVSAEILNSPDGHVWQLESDRSKHSLSRSLHALRAVKIIEENKELFSQYGVPNIRMKFWEMALLGCENGDAKKGKEFDVFRYCFTAGCPKTLDQLTTTTLLSQTPQTEMCTIVKGYLKYLQESEETGIVKKLRMTEVRVLRWFRSCTPKQQKEILFALKDPRSFGNLDNLFSDPNLYHLGHQPVQKLGPLRKLIIAGLEGKHAPEILMQSKQQDIERNQKLKVLLARAKNIPGYKFLQPCARQAVETLALKCEKNTICTVSDRDILTLVYVLSSGNFDPEQFFHLFDELKPNGKTQN